MLKSFRIVTANNHKYEVQGHTMEAVARSEGIWFSTGSRFTVIDTTTGEKSCYIRKNNETVRIDNKT